MNPLNQTEEKREAVPNGVSRVGIAALGVLLQVLWICLLYTSTSSTMSTMPTL